MLPALYHVSVEALTVSRDNLSLRLSVMPTVCLCPSATGCSPSVFAFVLSQSGTLSTV